MSPKEKNLLSSTEETYREGDLLKRLEKRSRAKNDMIDRNLELMRQGKRPPKMGKANKR